MPTFTPSHSCSVTKTYAWPHRYQHLSPAYLQDAVKGLDGVFGPELGKISPLPVEEAKKTDHDGVTIESKNGYKPMLTVPSLG